MLEWVLEIMSIRAFTHKRIRANLWRDSLGYTKATYCLLATKEYEGKPNKINLMSLFFLFSIMTRIFPNIKFIS